MRIPLLMAAALVTAVTAVGTTGSAGAIVGGEKSTQPYPFMASVRMPDMPRYQCGGSLVGQRWVLTAAHCVDGLEPAKFEIRFGSLDSRSGGEVRAVRKTVLHPEWRRPTGVPNDWYDAALLELDRPVRLTPIPIAADSNAGSLTRLLGWGRSCSEFVCQDPQPERYLKQFNTLVLPDKNCAMDTITWNGEVEICTYSPKGHSICQGDSGGPQIRRGTDGHWELLGIASHFASDEDKVECDAAPSVYADATVIKDWVTRQAK